MGKTPSCKTQPVEHAAGVHQFDTRTEMGLQLWGIGPFKFPVPRPIELRHSPIRNIVLDESATLVTWAWNTKQVRALAEFLGCHRSIALDIGFSFGLVTRLVRGEGKLEQWTVNQRNLYL